MRVALVALPVIVVGGVLYRAGRSHPPPPAPSQAGKTRDCAFCHADLSRNYAHVGMARSFRSLANSMEEVPPAGRYYHARSGRQYEVARSGNTIVQRRYETNGEQVRLHVFELEATHVIGSGNHARTFFHRTEAGEFIELPLTWYSQEKRWALSPGFDTPAPPDFTRRADDSCLFCHNAYSASGGGTGNGIDCARCHGDGSRHAGLAATGAPSRDVRTSIVNPARLPAALQLDVCMQCHLETTSVELPQMIRRFDRGVFSYRPGEPLGSYIVHFDVESGKDRFEIVNQAYRLRQSACFRNSQGRLVCTTCHNPHTAVRGEAVVPWLRGKCAGCHPTVKSAGHPALATADCAGCHMPKRRTEDAVHVVMTDHRIARKPPRASLAAAQAETPRSFPGRLAVYYPELSEPDRDQYLGAALIMSNRDRAAGIALLERAMGTNTDGKALAVLAEGRLAEGDTAGAIRDFERARERGLRTARLDYNMAQAYETAGRTAEAARAYEDALRLQPAFPEGHYAFANFLMRRGELQPAIEHYRSAIRARPVYAEAFNNLGNVLSIQGNSAQAGEQFEQALRIDPAFGEAHDNMARLLAAAGRMTEAMTHARRAVALNPESAAARYNLGQLLQAGGSLGPAIAEYRRALESRPDFVEAHLALGAALADSGGIDAAIQEFQAVLKLRPDHTQARNYLEMARRMQRH
jgi:predicted CXXCH cytochrome family protein